MKLGQIRYQLVNKDRVIKLVFAYLEFSRRGTKKKVRFCLVSELRLFEWEETHKKVVGLVLVSLTTDSYTGVRFFLFVFRFSFFNYGVVKGSKVFSLQVQRNLVFFFFRWGILYSLLWLEILLLCTKKLRRLCEKNVQVTEACLKISKVRVGFFPAFPPKSSLDWRIEKPHPDLFFGVREF